MMTLEKFAEAVRSEVAKRLGAGFHVHVLKPVINNDIVQTQLCIEKEGQQFRPLSPLMQRKFRQMNGYPIMHIDIVPLRIRLYAFKVTFIRIGEVYAYT